MRSANALRALFHRGVSVTETDAGRAFYSEINYRLMQNEAGIEDALFMNAQNWQTIPRIIALLRTLGIPAAGIFDFDVLMDQDFQHIWPLLHLEPEDLRALQVTRNQVKQLMEAKGQEVCKTSGIAAFTGADRALIQGFIDEMTRFGIFFVPVGELECWLSGLGVARTRNKPAWLTEIFSRLGSDPTAGDYITPDNDDVWEFIKQIETWIENPEHLGIPD